MTDPTPQSAARALVEEAERLSAAATAGPWYAHNPDDSWAMNAFCVSRSESEPDVSEGEPDPDLIALTLLQQPRVVGAMDLDWEANAAFIARARTLLPALASALTAALDENDELQRRSRNAVGLRKIIAKIGMGEPIVPDGELGQDVHFVAMMLADGIKDRTFKPRALVAEARERRGRELLRDTEWVSDEETGDELCPCCRYPRPDHAADCALAAYLAELAP